MIPGRCPGIKFLTIIPELPQAAEGDDGYGAHDDEQPTGVMAAGDKQEHSGDSCDAEYAFDTDIHEKFPIPR